MRELSVAGVRHPLLDFGGTIDADGGAAPTAYVATESRSPVIFLNAGRISLLAQAQEDARRVVLVTDELSCLTPAFADVWREAGAAWVVRSPNGLREGFSGRRLSEIGEVFTVSGIRSIDDVDLAFLRPSAATTVQIMAVISCGTRRAPQRSWVVLWPESPRSPAEPSRGSGERTSRPETCGIARI
jgi:hypothetical protein